MIKLVQNEPALIMDTSKGRALVISDLHLGFERSFLKKGINIPSQTKKIYLRLKSIIDHFNPESIFILGDVKHGTAKIEDQEWLEIPSFFDKLGKLVKSIEIVRGNHDGGLGALLPNTVNIHSTRGTTVRSDKKKITLMHGHAWPFPSLFECDFLMMGHKHPAFEFKTQDGFRVLEPIWLVARWDKKVLATSFLRFCGIDLKHDPIALFKNTFKSKLGNPKIFVLPSFNPLLVGSAINSIDKTLLGPLLSSGSIKLKDSEIYLLDGSYLGHLSDKIT